MSIKSILVACFLMLSLPSFGQFWFGVKSGMQFTEQKYQEKSYTDSIDVKNILNWHIGGVLNYTTSDKYSIHTELLYEKVNREVNDRDNTADSIILRSQFTYHFLTVPVMFRIQFGRTPVRYYINVGPQLRFWAAGKARITADELNENREEGFIDVKVSFKDPGENPAADKYYVPNPNRVQYAFVFGGGVVLDLFNKSQRLMLDARYSWGHSIMAFNRGTEASQLSTYQENFEFRDNTIILSVAYLFGFDPMDVRKGASTIKKKKMR